VPPPPVLAMPALEACEGPHGLASPLPDACLETIDTDRPHQTDTPHVVPAGHVQVESALASLEVGYGPTRLGLFQDEYRFGLVSHMDAELLLDHAVFEPDARRFESPGPVGARVKVNIVEGGGWAPAITLVPWVLVPVAPSQALRGGPYVFLGWELPARLELEMNVGVLLRAQPAEGAAPVLASALTWTIVGDLRVFVDVYATGPDVQLGTGALWAFTRDVQIDAGTYVGLHGDEPAATPFVGLSVRR